MVATACVTFPCGFGVGWWSKGRGAAAPLPGGNGNEGPVAKGKPAADWTWQDLQDHLASKGMKTRRGQKRVGEMWFVPGEGMPLGPDDFAAIKKSGLPSGMFAAREFDTFQQAQKVAGDDIGNDKYGAFAWNKFVIQAEPKTLAKVKALLP
jgi:hypothetical protein